MQTFDCRGISRKFWQEFIAHSSIVRAYYLLFKIGKILTIMEQLNLKAMPNLSPVSQVDKITIQIGLPSRLKVYYRRNKKLLNYIGILVGAIILTVCMQSPSMAQMFGKMESDADTIGKYIPSATDAVTFLAEVFRMLVYGGIVVGALGAAFSFISNRGWESWAIVAVVCTVLGSILYLGETMVYGS